MATKQATPLTPAQKSILEHARRYTDGKVTWFPETIKGGARQKVLEGMSKRSLITGNGTNWFLSLEGYDALGIPRKAVISEQLLAETIDNTEAKQRTTANTREGSKQSQVLAMLQRPGGTTIEEICEATGWQQHTVRGVFAGTFKKKLGLTIVSEKFQGRARCYRILTSLG